VSFKDGRKYQSTKANLYRIREISDTLCREHSLSVIRSPQGRGMNYAEYMALKAGKRTWKDTIREDVDEAIKCCRAPSQFVPTLRKLGFEVRRRQVHGVRPRQGAVRKAQISRRQSEWPNIQHRIFDSKTVKATGADAERRLAATG
jgi:hypothetical protein